MADSQTTTLNPTPVNPGTYNPEVNATLPVGTPVSAVVGTASTVQAAEANNGTTKQNCTGILATPGVAGERAQVRYDGPLTLTTAEWDLIAGTEGGLSVGIPYYVSAATPGKLTSTIPSATGTYAVPVGIALSGETLLVLAQVAVGPHS